MSERSADDDKAGKAHWDQAWSARTLPVPMNPRAEGLRHYATRAFHAEFVRAFEGFVTRGARLLEIGCARSAWLPYLAKEHGFEVVGLDYSELGCEQEREILARAGVTGTVVCADLFSPPEHLLGSFDAVVSLGVVEHFEDTAGCVRACARFLRPGGRMVTEIPNMRGLPGRMMKAINRSVYDKHVPLDVEHLARAHRDAGLSVRSAHYILPLEWSALGVGHLRSKPLRLAAIGISAAISGAVWFLDERGLAPAPNPITSPYIFCVAEKPPGDA